MKERLAGGTSAIKTTVRRIDLEFPFDPGDVVQFFRTYFGPVHTTFSTLNAQQQNEYAAELERLWHENNEAAGDATLVHADYREVLATRS